MNKNNSQDQPRGGFLDDLTTARGALEALLAAFGQQRAEILDFFDEEYTDQLERSCRDAHLDIWEAISLLRRPSRVEAVACAWLLGD
ncbi:hypothetical protein ACU19_04775 [Actinobaculum suis]|uniref:hypothetical protein n=1 Tax=Actinobaculum suis TaxID=1657 RepID=UPI00066FB8C4|nr:hypothetical protein [Actinobaculum suis]KMY23293.1 hypothetical protein ACU19_04775 [Actinobaculum suis]